MNCTMCGRESPPHLTFCKECGQRLAPQTISPTRRMFRAAESEGPRAAEFPPTAQGPQYVPAAPPTAQAPTAQAPTAQGRATPWSVRDGSHAPSIPPSSSGPRGPCGRIVVIMQSGLDGPSYPLVDFVDIGRSEGNIIFGEDPYLSPRHVRLISSDGRLLLRDLASTNGTYLRLVPGRNGVGGPTPDETGHEALAPLEHRDYVLLGQQVIRFELLDENELGLGPAVEHGTLLFGSPTGPRYARLGQRTVEGVVRDVHHIRKMETVLGRESGDMQFAEDPFLSRRHAAIRVVMRDEGPTASPFPPRARVDGMRFFLADLGSSNGTFLRIRGDVELLHGDQFRVGQQLFRVELNAEATTSELSAARSPAGAGDS